MSSIGAMRLMFLVGSRTISGNLAGRFLHCTVRPPQGGALPPAGDYAILPPMNDPIYGRVALMAPAVGSFNLPAASMKTATLTAVTGKIYEKPDATPTAIGQKLFQKPDAAARAVSGRRMDYKDYKDYKEYKDDKDYKDYKPVDYKVYYKPVDFKPDRTPDAAGGQVFVLSDRPVLGRNSIVVGPGFADLMDAVQTAGGARVRVA